MWSCGTTEFTVKHSQVQKSDLLCHGMDGSHLSPGVEIVFIPSTKLGGTTLTGTYG
jgi:hypothetical protein